MKRVARSTDDIGEMDMCGRSVLDRVRAAPIVKNLEDLRRLIRWVDSSYSPYNGITLCGTLGADPSDAVTGV